MATFSFSPIKLNKEPKHSTVKNEILEHDVEGYIGIKLNGEFYVLYNNKEYLIKQENHDCKNIKNVYILKIEKNNRIYIARNENLQSLSKHFKPFAPGCIVKGNIIKINNKETFNIKHVYTDKFDTVSKKLFNYWKNNYNEIQKALGINV